MLTQYIGRYTPRIFTGTGGDMHASDLQVHITPSKGVVTVTLIGEAHFDFDAAEVHIKKVLSHNPKTVIIDAAHLSFISSVGMCFLMNLRRSLQNIGATLKVAALQPMVHRALEKAKVLSLFETHADLASARASAASEQGAPK